MFKYSQGSSLEENQASFNALSEAEREQIISEDHDAAIKQEFELIESARRQDIETAKRALEGANPDLESLYKGYFGSRENCQLVANLIPEEMFSIPNPKIVDAGSSQGTLGNYIAEKFSEKGSHPHLTMIDTNKVAMDASPVQAEKIEADLLQNPLESNSVDLVLLRSVLQYVEFAKQLEILKEIYRTLKPGGLLISQFGSFEDQNQADALNRVFGYVNRRVRFSGKEEGLALHEQVFGKALETAPGPTVNETFDEFFVKRVAATESQMEQAKEYIATHLNELGDFLTDTNPEHYAWKFPFTIASYRKEDSGS